MTGDFAAALRSLRADAGLTQSRLAVLTGLSTEGISALERGERRRPRLETVDLLCRGLGLDDAGAARLRALARPERPCEPGGRTRSRRPQPRRATGWPVPRQLPLGPRHLVGRGAELATVLAALAPGEGPALVVVSGMPGVGKTALVRRAASLAAPDFPDGQIHLDLRASATAQPLDARRALEHLLAALGVPAQQIPDDVTCAAAEYRSLMAERRVLVVVENATSHDDIELLLPGGGTSAVVVTSRQRLELPPATTVVTVAPLDAEAGRALLAGHLGAPRLEADPVSADAIVAACAGLPLALHIAASRLASRPAWPLSHLAERLTDPGERLDELATGDLAVRTAVTRAVEQLRRSDDLAAEAADVLVHVGLLPEPTVAPVVVAALLGIGERSARLALDRLADASLIECTGPDRYRVHDLVHGWAQHEVRRTLDEAGRSTALRRLVVWCTAVGWRAVPEYRQLDGPVAVETAEVAERLSPQECQHLLGSAIDQLYSLLVDPDRLPDEIGCPLRCRAVVGLRGYFVLHEYTTRWSALVESALACSDDACPERGRLWEDYSIALSSRGLFDRSIDAARRAVGCFAAAGERRAEGMARVGLGVSLFFQRRLGEARSELEAAVRFGEDHADDRTVAGATRSLGVVLAALGDPAGGLVQERESLRRYELLDLTRGVAMASVNIASMLCDLGRLDEARAPLLRARTLFGEAEDVPGQVESLQTLARWRVLAGDQRGGADALRQALELNDRLSPEGVVDEWSVRLHRALAEVYAAMGDEESAIRHHSTAAAHSCPADAAGVSPAPAR